MERGFWEVRQGWAVRKEADFTKGHIEDLQVSIFPPKAYPLGVTEED